MQLTILVGYPDNVGRRHIFCGHGHGPASYSDADKDKLEPFRFGMTYDVVFPAMTVSGNYIVYPHPDGVGPRREWKLKWVKADDGEEVSHGHNLSQEQVQIGGYCGQF
jgi:hypothetical protein